MNKNTRLEATEKGRNVAAELAFDWELIKIIKMLNRRRMTNLNVFIFISLIFFSNLFGKKTSFNSFTSISYLSIRIHFHSFGQSTSPFFSREEGKICENEN